MTKLSFAVVGYLIAALLLAVAVLKDTTSNRADFDRRDDLDEGQVVYSVSQDTAELEDGIRVARRRLGELQADIESMKGSEMLSRDVEEGVLKSIVDETLGDDFDIVDQNGESDSDFILRFKSMSLSAAKSSIERRSVINKMHKATLVGIGVQQNREKKILQELGNAATMREALIRKLIRSEVDREQYESEMEKLEDKAILSEFLTASEFQDYYKSRGDVSKSQAKKDLHNKIALFEPLLPEEVIELTTDTYHTSAQVEVMKDDSELTPVQKDTNQKMHRINRTLGALKNELDDRDYQIVSGFFQLQEENALMIERIVN